MKLKFIFLGKKTSSFHLITSNYLERLNYYVKSEVLFCLEKNKEKLQKKILKSIKSTDYLIVLDDKGESMNTLQYSNLIQDKLTNYDMIIFLVGDAYGIPEGIFKRSNFVFSLSKMVFPHLITRLILLEQTYRVFTIFNNHPYHHE